MAEILALGWNVATPEVDTGTDVFVAQDDGGQLTRVQVKSALATTSDGGVTWVTGTFGLPYAQLMNEDEEVPLLYVFAARLEDRWEFVVISREDLRQKRLEFDGRPKVDPVTGKRTGGRPRKDPSGPRGGDFDLTFRQGDVLGFGSVSFQEYRNNWRQFRLLMQDDGASETTTEAHQTSNREPPPATPAPSGAPGTNPSGG